MALGERYNVYANNAFGGEDRVVKIYQEGYSGSVEDLEGGAEPVALEVIPAGDGSPFDPILGSELTVTVRVDTADLLEDFGLAKQKKYFAVLYNSTSGSDEWRGWNLPEEYEQPHTQGPHDITLRFTCGLGLLANYPYKDGSDYWRGRQSIITILGNLFSNIIPDTSLAADMYVIISLVPTSGSTATSSSALSQAYVNRDRYINEDGSVWTCLEVLIDVLKPFGARIVMGIGGWYITRIRDMAMLADGKDIQWVRYSYAGTYEAWGYLSTTRVINHTGIGVAGRASDVWWLTGAIMRFEKAVKDVAVMHDYGYKNIIAAGNMNDPAYPPYGMPDWVFWTSVVSGGGSAGFVQSNEEEDKTVAYCRANRYYGSPPYAELYQTIEDVQTGTNQNLVLTAEVMLEGDEGVTGSTVFMEARIDADLGSSYDRWARNTGAWANTDGRIAFDISAKAGQWTNVSIELDDIPYAGDLTIAVHNPYSSDAGVVGCRWRNVKLLGLYDYEAPDKSTTETMEISTDNLETMEVAEVGLGDVDLSGNEGIFFKGSISRNNTGTQNTTSWRSYYISGSSKVAYGPQQTLLQYLRDQYIVQKGITTRRIRGVMNLDSRLLASSIYEEDGKYYYFLNWRQDFRRCLVDCQVMELPPIEQDIFEVNLISGWTDYITGWTTMTITADPLIDVLAASGGTSGTAQADAIESLVPYESFRVRVTGTFTGALPRLTIGSWYDTIDDGFDEIITPRSTAGNSTPYLANVTGLAASHSNVLITVTRIYGF